MLLHKCQWQSHPKSASSQRSSVCIWYKLQPLPAAGVHDTAEQQGMAAGCQEARGAAPMPQQKMTYVQEGLYLYLMPEGSNVRAGLNEGRVLARVQHQLPCVHARQAPHLRSMRERLIRLTKIPGSPLPAMSYVRLATVERNHIEEKRSVHRHNLHRACEHQ